MKRIPRISLQGASTCDGVGVVVEKKTKSYQCTLLFGGADTAIIDARRRCTLSALASRETIALLKRARASPERKKS